MMQNFHEWLQSLEGADFKQEVWSLGVIAPEHPKNLHRSTEWMKDWIDDGMTAYGTEEQVTVYESSNTRALVFQEDYDPESDTMYATVVRQGKLSEDRKETFGVGLKLLAEDYEFTHVYETVFDSGGELFKRMENVVKENELPSAYHDAVDELAEDIYDVTEEDVAPYRDMLEE